MVTRRVTVLPRLHRCQESSCHAISSSNLTARAARRNRNLGRLDYFLIVNRAVFGADPFAAPGAVAVIVAR